MSFFRSFFYTCCGSHVFQSLSKHGWGRALWHFVLVCLFCGIGVGLGNYFMLGYRWRAAYNEFTDIFGSRVEFTEKGIIPEYNPEISRRQELPFNSLIIYVSPNGPEKDYPDETLETRNVIILWAPACVAIFTRTRDDWQCSALYGPDGKLQQTNLILNYQDMRKELQRLCELPGADNWFFPESFAEGLNSQQLFSMIRLSFAFGKGLAFMLLSLFLGLLSTLFFSLVFKVVAGNKIPAFTFGKLWKIAIYTTFPVLLVVNAFPALQLPGVGFFDWMFIFGWLIYLFRVLRYMINNPEPVENNSKGDDSDERI